MTSVDPDNLRLSAQDLRAQIEQASTAAETSAAHDMSWDIWGLPGLLFANKYGELQDEFKDYLTQAADGIDTQANKLEAAANDWEEADEAISREFSDLLDDGSETMGRWDRFGQRTGSDGATSLVNIPNFGAPNKAFNLVSNFISTIQANNLSEGVSGASSVLGDIHSFAAGISNMITDPIKHLIACGMDFLVTFIQPLNDILGMVTGNPGKMDEEIQKWGDVRGQLEPLADGVINSWDNNLSDWEGDDGDNAYQATCDFSEAVISFSGITYDLQAMVEGAKALAEGLRGIIYDLLSEWIWKNIKQWIVATALAIVTKGVSVVKAKIYSAITALIDKLQAIEKKFQATEKYANIVSVLNTIATKTSEFHTKFGKFGEYFVQAGIGTIGAAATDTAHSSENLEGIESDLSFDY